MRTSLIFLFAALITLSIAPASEHKNEFDCVEKLDAKDFKKACDKYKGKIVKGECVLEYPKMDWKQIKSDWKVSCKNSGGAIEDFSGHDMSQDKCQFFKQSSIIPTADIKKATQGCDCGESKCWHENSGKGACIQNPTWQRMYDNESNLMKYMFKCASEQ